MLAGVDKTVGRTERGIIGLVTGVWGVGVIVFKMRYSVRGG